MRNIVLLAPLGQVGFELLRSLAPLGRVYTLSRSDVDFADTAATAAKVAALAPDIIVNAAAWTAVDKAETERDAAYLLNAALPAALAVVAKQHNAWLVHYSTDYVYPGTGDSPWQETDPTAPLSVYGASKLAGDEAIMATCSRYVIFRTSWVYAARGTNFMRTMLKLAQSRETLNVVADQIGAPTPAGLIANVTALALQQLLSSSDGAAEAKSGVYHLACRGVTSWHGFAEAIFALAHQRGVALTLTDCQPINTAQYPTVATRPANSRLDVSKLERQFGLQLPDWHSQLTLTFSQLLAQ